MLCEPSWFQRREITDIYILNSNHLVEYKVCKSNIGHKLNGSKCCKKRLQGRGGGEGEGRRKVKLEKVEQEIHNQ